jgi:hypothetical protein
MSYIIGVYMKLTIKMKPSKAWNRRYDYIVMRGNEVIAVCTDLKSAETIKKLQANHLHTSCDVRSLSAYSFITS